MKWNFGRVFDLKKNFKSPKLVLHVLCQRFPNLFLQELCLSFPRLQTIWVWGRQWRLRSVGALSGDPVSWYTGIALRCRLTTKLFMNKWLKSSEWMIRVTSYVFCQTYMHILYTIYNYTAIKGTVFFFSRISSFLCTFKGKIEWMNEKAVFFFRFLEKNQFWNRMNGPRTFPRAQKLENLPKISWKRKKWTCFISVFSEKKNTIFEFEWMSGQRT